MERISEIRKYIKKTAALLTAALTVLSSGAVKAYAEDNGEKTDIKKAGVITGGVFDVIVNEKYPDIEILYYNSTPDLVIALRDGKIDAFASDRPVAEQLVRNDPSMEVAKEMISSDDYGFIFPKNEKGEKLQRQFNEYLKKCAGSGEMEGFMARRFEADDASPVDIPSTGENGIINMATTSVYPPFSFMGEGGITGFDFDIFAGFCKEYGYGAKISDIETSAVIAGVAAGKYDMYASTTSITEERKQSVLFSDPYYNGGIVFVIRNESGYSEKSGILSGIAESFEKTFIREQRYKLILKGVGTTLLISVLSMIAGTVLGFGICMMRLSKLKALSVIASVYIRLLQGTPIVVFLMIMNYIVFRSSGTDPLWVAVIGFAMNFAAYAAEIMRTGIEAVDNGQTEAAKAMGFTPAGTFFKVVLPQAAAHFLPVYKGEVISLVKSTSVVGYIAVQDLTKMSDIIRSRTYEAFFPLIATAVIYFILAWLLTLILNRVMKIISPSGRKRTVKGVVMK